VRTNGIVVVKFTESELNILYESLKYMLQIKNLSVFDDADKLKNDLEDINKWICNEKEKAKEKAKEKH
jgi:hypothetical protein|tara:strand:- start:750 stop:953 length:204 start_codon:yes stop_codon:yes gene_type:complete